MNKPKFDPSKSFEAAGATKPKFDPNKPFDAPKGPSQLESSLRGAAQGAFFGFADEATAAAEALFSDKSYDQARDESRAAYDAAQAANPATFMAGNIGGSLATSFIPGLGVLNAAKGATTAGRVGIAAAQGGLSALGSSKAENALEMARDTAIGGATGAAFQGIGEKVIGPLVSKAGGALQSASKNLTERAVGATGKQASKFQPGTGEFLLKNKLVGFGDTPADIAEKISKFKNNAGEKIGSSLQRLDDQGAMASIDDIVESLQAKIVELEKSSGNKRLIRQIQDEIDDLHGQGNSMPLSLAEESKKNYAGSVNYNSAEVDKKGATHLASVFRDEVEKKAAAADPELAKIFMENKKNFGLLAPVEEAAVARGLQQANTPALGMNDLLAMGASITAGDPTAGIGGAVLRRGIAPRIFSSSAITAQAIGNTLRKNPQAFGKWSGALSSAAARGQDAFNVTHHLLQQTDEGYRTMMRKMGEEGQ